MYVAVYSTAPSMKDGKRIARMLVEKKLVACVNLIPIQSIYRWKGQIEDESEVILWCKTREHLITAVRATIDEIHPYEIPAFAVYPIQTGSEAYLQWIIDETSSSPST